MISERQRGLESNILNYFNKKWFTDLPMERLSAALICKFPNFASQDNIILKQGPFLNLYVAIKLYCIVLVVAFLRFWPMPMKGKVSRFTIS